MRTTTDVITALLATLPKCHACEQPATRFFMSHHRPIPTFFECVKGKRFELRGYTGPSFGAASYVPTDGVDIWDCCDDHVMPDPLGEWDFPVAPAVRRGLSLLAEGSDR